MDDWLWSNGAMSAYLCIVIEKLMRGLMTAGTTFTNNKAIKDKAIRAVDLEPYCKADFSFSKILQNIKDAVDSQKAWDNYPPFLEAMFQSHKNP